MSDKIRIQFSYNDDGSGPTIESSVGMHDAPRLVHKITTECYRDSLVSVDGWAIKAQDVIQSTLHVSTRVVTLKPDVRVNVHTGRAVGVHSVYKDRNIATHDLLSMWWAFQCVDASSSPIIEIRCFKSRVQDLLLNVREKALNWRDDTRRQRHVAAFLLRELDSVVGYNDCAVVGAAGSIDEADFFGYRGGAIIDVANCTIARYGELSYE